MAERPNPKNIDEYIASFPPDVQEILERIRLTIRNAAPRAQRIPYGLIARLVKFRVKQKTSRRNRRTALTRKRGDSGTFPTPSSLA
jgi:uncharacterized protein YdhG (YjbR/CyaY superfamily)